MFGTKQHKIQRQIVHGPFNYGTRVKNVRCPEVFKTKTEKSNGSDVMSPSHIWCRVDVAPPPTSD